MNLIDVVLLVLVAAYAAGGYRRGAVVGVLSFVGFFGGAVLGAQWASPISDRISSGRASVPVGILCVVVTAMAGQFLAVLVAGRLRTLVVHGPVRIADNIGGAVVAGLSVLLVAWMVAVPLASSPYPSLVSQLRRSQVIRAVDNSMPDGLRSLYSSLRSFIDQSGFPQVFGALQPTTVQSVAPADPKLLASPVVAAAKSSVLKVNSIAESCSRGIEGSSFVYAPQRVLTNAHVVAGASSVAVETASQGELRAKVVVFDPERDVAVLYVPGLRARVLSLATTVAKTGQDAIVLGYPNDGPFDVRAARIRDRQELSGKDIYGSATVRRDIYSIRSVVRVGNSGGPLLDTSGSVLGIVFASALDSSDTGFVLTAQEVGSDAAQGRTATAAVGTGDCD